MSSRKPPKHLGSAGRELWLGIVEDYGIDDAAGLALVTAAAECMDRIRAAQALIVKHGECVATTGGSLKTNPACRIETDARNGLLAAIRMLNLDLEPLRDHPGRPPGTFRSESRTNGHADA